MNVLFNHAIRWKIHSSNPISGRARKAGVRQSGMRQETPDILELDEMRSQLEYLAIREKALVSTDMITGLQRQKYVLQQSSTNANSTKLSCPAFPLNLPKR